MTRAHILNSSLETLRCDSDPYADVRDGRIVVRDALGGAVLTVGARQARLLAYLLCEAADEAEGDA